MLDDSHCEWEVITVWNQNEVTGKWNCSALFEINKDFNNWYLRRVMSWLEKEPALSFDVTKQEVFFCAEHSIFCVEIWRFWKSRKIFTRVTSKKHFKSTFALSRDHHNDWPFSFNSLPHWFKLTWWVLITCRSMHQRPLRRQCLANLGGANFSYNLFECINDCSSLLRLQEVCR